MKNKTNRYVSSPDLMSEPEERFANSLGKKITVSEPVVHVAEKEIVIDMREMRVVEKPEFFLVVLSPFRNYKRGDLIRDFNEIKKIESCHEVAMTTKIKAQ